MGKKSSVSENKRAKIVTLLNEGYSERQISVKEEQKCTKEEYAVAKHLRFNTPVYAGKLAGMTVKCFKASEAVNCLLDSKWSKGNVSPESEIVFSDRRSCVQFLNRFIETGLFHRADKIVRKKTDKLKKNKADDNEKDGAIDEKSTDKPTDKSSKKDKRLIMQDDKKSKKLDAVEVKKVNKKKTDDKNVKVKSFKLDMSDDQRFVDGNSIYVWVYDPIQPKSFIIGFLMLVGAVVLCLFPLWPDWMRIAVYYASLLGASLVGFMLFLIVLRVIIFSCVWLLTLGKHHLWIFPNLTEDVGVLESFKPFYKHDVHPQPEMEEEHSELKTENSDQSLKVDNSLENENSEEKLDGIEITTKNDDDDINVNDDDIGDNDKAESNDDCEDENEDDTYDGEADVNNDDSDKKR